MRVGHRIVVRRRLEALDVDIQTLPMHIGVAGSADLLSTLKVSRDRQVPRWAGCDRHTACKYSFGKLRASSFHIGSGDDGPSYSQSHQTFP